MWPDGFLDGLQAAGVRVPETLLEAYDLMCEALYEGVKERGEEGGGRRGGYQNGLWFGDASLLRVKARVDRRLAETADALRAWAAARSRC